MEVDILNYLAVAIVAFVLGRLSTGARKDIFRTQSGSVVGKSLDEYIGSLSPQVRAEIENLMHNEQKIAAIKLFRERTGANLKDAKAAVEKLWPAT